MPDAKRFKPCELVYELRGVIDDGSPDAIPAVLSGQRINYRDIAHLSQVLVELVDKANAELTGPADPLPAAPEPTPSRAQRRSSAK